MRPVRAGGVEVAIILEKSTGLSAIGPRKNSKSGKEPELTPHPNDNRRREDPAAGPRGTTHHSTSKLDAQHVDALRLELSSSSATLDELLAMRPDLSATINRFHAAGFEMVVVGDIHDRDRKPMLIIGERESKPDSAPPTTPAPATAGQNASPPPPPAAVNVPTPAKRTVGKLPKGIVAVEALADPSTFPPRSPEGKLQRKIDKNGGVWEHAALFDLAGNPVPAILKPTRFGFAWAVYANQKCTGKVVQWVGYSSAHNLQMRIKTVESKGYRIGIVRARSQAQAIQEGRKKSAKVTRTDGGFDPEAEVVKVFAPELY